MRAWLAASPTTDLSASFLGARQLAPSLATFTSSRCMAPVVDRTFARASSRLRNMTHSPVRWSRSATRDHSFNIQFVLPLSPLDPALPEPLEMYSHISTVSWGRWHLRRYAQRLPERSLHRLMCRVALRGQRRYRDAVS